MKPQTILLQQADSDDNLYIVVQLVNRIEPRVGSVFRTGEVRQYVSQRDTKVTIKQAKP